MLSSNSVLIKKISLVFIIFKFQFSIIRFIHSKNSLISKSSEGYGIPLTTEILSLKKGVRQKNISNITSMHCQIKDKVKTNCSDEQVRIQGDARRDKGRFVDKYKNIDPTITDLHSRFLF